MHFKVLLTCIAIISSSLSAVSEIVELSNGYLNGIQRNDFLAFEGIPYAKPPIGDLRFEPPQPYTDKWEGVRYAHQLGPYCLQWDHFKEGANKLVGEEDCLFLNVYTPSLNAAERYPVVAYIHGGAFMFGGLKDKRVDHLLRRSYVVVTFNYRLGPLGFLSTESSTVPGNMGMKDQVLALQWVKQNIAVFGGDPEMVTLTGFSAGGASVHLHTMSNMTNGLFHRAIAHSGSALNPWVQAVGMMNKTKAIAIAVGCTTSIEEQEIIQCLKQKPGSEIVATVAKFLKFLYNPFSPFGVVVEGDHEGAFLADKPINLLQQKRVHKIPFIASAVETEGLYPSAEFYNDLIISEIENHWNEFMPAILDYQHTAQEGALTSVSEKIRRHYLGADTLTKTSFNKFSKLVTDRLYLSDIGLAIRLHQQATPVYFYYYTYNSMYNDPGKECLGVSHGADQLMYKYRKTPFTNDEETMVESMLDMYETFSATGIPVFGDTKLAETTVDESGTFTCNEIQGPRLVQVKSFNNFGDFQFWSGLGLKENVGDN